MFMYVCLCICMIVYAFFCLYVYVLYMSLCTISKEKKIIEIQCLNREKLDVISVPQEQMKINFSVLTIMLQLIKTLKYNVL